jgi:hypothetical protein
VEIGTQFPNGGHELTGAHFGNDFAQFSESGE